MNLWYSENKSPEGPFEIRNSKYKIRNFKFEIQYLNQPINQSNQ